MKKNRGQGEMSLSHPPALNYEIIHTRTLRYTVTAAILAGQNITFQNLLDTILFATTAIAPYDVFDLVRVRRVSVWAQSALGTPATVTVTFNTATGDRKIHTDTSLGIRPACVHARPDMHSLASFFTASAATNVFNISCPAGSVVDIQLSLKDTPGLAVAAQNASVGTTVGSVFYRGLDGLAFAGTNFVPPIGIVAG